MTTLKETAQGYEPKQTLNIADLESFDINEPTELRTGIDKDDKEFEYYVLIREDKEYRIPNGVMNDIKNILLVNAEHDKEVNTFAVKKTGEGLKTRYSIVTI